MTRHRKTPHSHRKFGIPAKFLTTISRCNHTLYHRTNDGLLQGTWMEEHGQYGTRVVCRSCGKFYGYMPLDNDLGESVVFAAYLSQRGQQSENGSSIQN